MFDWIDISLPLYPDMVQGPDDPPFKIEPLQDLNGSDRANASRITMSSHTGTHIDAPVQVLEKKRNLDALSFSATVGLARVVEIYDKKTVTLEELRRHRMFPHERILLKTKNSSHIRSSNPIDHKEWIYLDQDAAVWLAERRISTVGMDSLSIGGDTKYGTTTYRNLLDAGICIIEGLDLSQVKPGEYMLICLPLKIKDGEGAPARAILQWVK